MENDAKKEELCGIVNRITYQNIQNGYTVAVLHTTDGEITVVGTLPLVVEGDNLKLIGKYVVHSTYGRQFAVETFEKQLPTTAAAILRYLSAGVIKGVGPSTAKNLVEVFGEKTLEVIENSPEDLTRVRGISAERALSISNAFKKQFGIRDVMLMLGEFKISPEDSLKVYTDGDFIKADGTTLGADKGIAVAMTLAILENDKIPHPEIQAVFTTD